MRNYKNKVNQQRKVVTRMSNPIKCFEVVDSVVCMANERFGKLWEVNQNCYEILHIQCNTIDSILEEFGGTTIEVGIDEIRMTISITIECEDVTLKFKMYKFYKFMEVALSITVFDAKNGIVKTEFIFPSIWDRSICLYENLIER